MCMKPNLSLNTPQCTQCKSNMTTVCGTTSRPTVATTKLQLKVSLIWRQCIEVNSSVCWRILEAKLQLNFFNLWTSITRNHKSNKFSHCLTSLIIPQSLAFTSIRCRHVRLAFSQSSVVATVDLLVVPSTRICISICDETMSHPKSILHQMSWKWSLTKRVGLER